MNYIKHLSGFFDKVSKDDRLNPTHVSLYVSLFQFWNACRFSNPISISRNEAMKVSKINSKATYHKCMRELNDFGYLSYQPSYNPFKGSLVYLFNFQLAVDKNSNQTKYETSSELAVNGYRTKNETSSEQALNKQRTSSEQALVSYINNTNIINNTNSTNKTKQQTRVNALTQKNSNEKNIESSEIDSGKYAGTKKRNSAAAPAEKKEQSGTKAPPHPKSRRKRPFLEEIRAYFVSKGWPEKEADKFYNHYESNGWLVGGKTPMQNWQASADKWESNSESFSHSEKFSLSLPKRSRSPVQKINTAVEKDYGEPL